MGGSHYCAPFRSLPTTTAGRILRATSGWTLSASSRSSRVCHRAPPHRKSAAHDAQTGRAHRRARATRSATRHRLCCRQGRREDRNLGGLGRRTAASPGLHLSLRHKYRCTRIRGPHAVIDALDLLWPSFLVATCLVAIHSHLGLQVLARKVIFVDLALAQVAALGATVAFMLGHSAQSVATYGYSCVFTLLAAVVLAFTRAWAARV